MTKIKKECYILSKAICDLYVNSDWYKEKKLKPNNVFDVWKPFSIDNNQGVVAWNYNKPKKKYMLNTGSNEGEDWALNFKRYQTQIKNTCENAKGETGKIMDRYLKPDTKAKLIDIIKIIGVRFHTGFFIGAIKLFEFALDIARKSNSIVIAGHSYGAAVSTILAFLLELFRVFHNEKYNIDHVQPESSPRCMNQAGARYYNMLLGLKTYRIFHTGDIVCRVPWWGYEHILIECKLGELKWWQLISKIFGLPGWHYPDLLPKLIRKEL